MPSIVCTRLYQSRQYCFVIEPTGDLPLHRVTNINWDSRTGDCAVCGPSIRVKVYRTASGRVQRWCMGPLSTRVLKRREQRNAKRGDRRNFTIREAAQWLAKLDGICEVCKREARLVPDHDHRTGEFRGGLCGRCNTGIGFFQDDPVRLQAAIDYLGKHRSV